MFGRSLRGYSLTIAAFALVTGVWATERTWHATPVVSWVGLVLLGLGLVVTEATPVRLTTRGSRTAVTFSGGFSIALAISAPLWVALVAQLIATAYDDLRTRDRWIVLFNLSQYVVLLSGVSLAFTLVAGEPTLAGGGVSPRETAGILAAGLAYVLINHTAVSGLIAVRSGRPYRMALGNSLELSALGYSMDLALAPLAIAAAEVSLIFIPLVALPTIVMFLSTRVASEKEREALHDVLTGLPNRALLRQRFDTIAKGVAGGEDACAVLLVDLDHFKPVNDTYGHSVGDDVLREVSRRLVSAAREGDTVCRLGGDEFAILARVDPDHRRAESEAVAERYTQVLREPMVLDGLRLGVQGSVGLAIGPDHGTDLETLTGRADVALYRAKSDRGRWAAYDDQEQEEDSARRRSQISRLQAALDAREVEVWFVPERSERTGALTCARPVPRWNHPELGLIAPSSVVPISDDSDLAALLTQSVLDQALTQMRRWVSDGLSPAVSIALSAQQLADPDLPTRLRALLLRHNVDPALLALRLREADVLADTIRAAGGLVELAATGVRLELNDYRAADGIYAVRALSRLGITDLRLASAFAQQVTGTDEPAREVRALLNLGAQLGLGLWTDRVEDAAAAQVLETLGCTVIAAPDETHPLSSTGIAEEWRSVSAGGPPAVRAGAD